MGQEVAAETAGQCLLRIATVGKVGEFVGQALPVEEAGDGLNVDIVVDQDNLDGLIGVRDHAAWFAAFFWPGQ